MKNNIGISLIQTAPRWERPDENLKLFSRKISEIPDGSNLILLPEMFSTGFSMNPQTLASTMEGREIEWMQETAAKNQCALAGSLMIRDNQAYYNRFVIALPDGSMDTYDKKHLFRMGNEHIDYTPGSRRKIFEFLGWRFLPVICYDLRFPVWLRNKEDYDCMLVVANWPAPRAEVWLTLLKARAIENQVYVAGVNRIGTDGRNIKYEGDSLLIDFKGQVLKQAEKDQEDIVRGDFDTQKLDDFKNKFPAYLDRDQFLLE